MFRRLAFCIPILIMIWVSSIGQTGPLAIAGAGPPDQVVHSFDISDPKPPEAVVSLRGGGSAFAKFSIEVSIDKAPVGEVDVDLVAACSAGWVASVNPTHITFERSGMQYASVLVSVPAHTSADQWCEVDIEGWAQFPGGQLYDSSSGIVRIQRQYLGEIKARPERGGGNPQAFDINITNKGNGKDSFMLDIGNRAELEDEGFEFEFSATKTKELDIQEGDDIELEVAFGSKTPWGEHVITVEATSMGADRDVNATHVCHINVFIEVGSLKEGNPRIYCLGGVIILVVSAISAVVLIRRRRKRRRSIKRRSKKAP
jgi:hypothetical protein